MTIAVAVTSLLFVVPSPRFGAETVRAAENARQIVAEAQKRSESASQRYDGLLQSFDKSGRATEKRWTYERLGSHGQSKSVIRFTAPAEVKGVALLVVNHTDRASDQWMWTPAIERDRRVALQDRSTRFFGTDFTFEDLEERDIDQFQYALLGDEALDGIACWKIESTPTGSKSSQYSRTIVWIRKDNYASARIDSYVGPEAVRRLNYGDIRQLQGIWTAHELTMIDLKRGTRTRLVLDRVEYGVPLSDGHFTLQAIRR
jgi:hypothetical protein